MAEPNHEPESEVQETAERKPTSVGDGSDQAPVRVVDRDLFGRAPKRTKDWSHRRGEPRVFALFWTMYVMAATLMMFAFAGGMGSFDVQTFRPSARIAMAVVLVGIVVLWPMTRLSQIAPAAGGVVPTLKDAVIIGFPAQAFIWPQLLLSRWPFMVVLALSALFAVWTLLIAAFIAGGLGPPRSDAYRDSMSDEARDTMATSRWVAMGLALASGVLTAFVPVLDPSPLQDVLRSRPAWLANPITGMFEVTRDRSFAGPPAAVGPTHWLTIAALAGLALGAWAVTLVISLAPVPVSPSRHAKES